MSLRFFVVRPTYTVHRLLSTRSCAMPLRAKITGHATRQMSSAPEPIRELPGDEVDDVLFNNSFGVRTIELNRPKKLNSLNGSMVRKIVPRLLEWEKSQMSNIVIMKGAGDRALCAGGDVAALALWNQEGPEGQQRSKEYFGLEYKLDHLIAAYSKPYIAFMDGITMGGGVGLSVHAPFRIATERTVFAMPETTIGFFPEVGGSFFLPRLDGALGTYLALTSEQVRGVNVFWNGVATHYLHSSSLPDLEQRLSELVFKDYASMNERYQVINSTIEEFHTGFPHDQPMTLAGDTRAAIDRCFSFTDIDSILDALKKENNQWAEKTIKTITDRGPTSVKVTLRQMQLGKNWSIDEAFQREYHIAGKFMVHPDFVEGVSAKLIRKPPQPPQWQPATLKEVDDKTVDDFFVIPSGAERLQLLKDGPSGKYKSYPHAWIGLPTEKEIMDAVNGSKQSRKEITQYFVEGRQGKAGVREKVDEVLARKTQEVDGVTSWQS